MDVHASNKSALDESTSENPCPNWMFAQIEKMNEYHMRLPEEGEEYIADDDEPPMLDDGDDDDEGGEKDEDDGVSIREPLGASRPSHWERRPYLRRS